MPTQRAKEEEEEEEKRGADLGGSLRQARLSLHHTWSGSQPVDLSIDDGHLQRPASPPIVQSL